MHGIALSTCSPSFCTPPARHSTKVTLCRSTQNGNVTCGYLGPLNIWLGAANVTLSLRKGTVVNQGVRSRPV